ncbi:dialkylresorcinol condensing enzyme [Sinimarinibacterium sp. CAU 1509]|uniref:dialkylrecorsinol condensing enzyme n=1 Tax=Sinimarinibacterium sp. CAU 1509 TaxID=2562283 RepID=UPI0010AD3596|nr:dialkylrecorsinol condensing enzyme [Sinimarinibacterium sp. CAU 1509]TJY62316.1 dialkylresorcinol condensing enzyme [Sinimarinibacterium sp. CAU 1509]
MGKRILAVYFSQTGQLKRCAEAMAAPVQADPQIALDWCELRPQAPYPFPWPFFTFFDQFPETVHLVPPALEPLQIPAQRYDLIVLAYTVWFLSPAPPVTAFLKSDTGRALLHDTPVITLIACRNMWHMAQEQVKALLADAGARLSDNVVLTDAGSSLATFITTPRWMLTGRTDPLWGLPAPGIRDSEIAATRRFGDAIVTALHENRVDGRTPVLSGLGAVDADVRLVPSEKIGRRSFYLWGKLIRACGKPGAAARKPALALYAVFLVLMIVTVVPVTMLLRALLRPLTRRRQAAQKAYFEQPSGSSRLRLDERAHG